MEEFIDDKIEDGNREMAPKEKFSKLFDELKSCSVSEQKEKIEEMNRMIDEMNKEELYSTFTKEQFEKIDKMIEEEKLTMGNAILLLKHMGYCNILKSIYIEDFFFSSFNGRFEEMIVDEEQNKEKRKENLLTGLCECYLLLNIGTSSQLISDCAPCLLKAALKKEENEEAQKEVEMALLALSCIDIIERDLFLNEIKEIIQYHQKRCNLTQLAYQSAWGFLIKRFELDKSLEVVIANELHFIREARREVEELWKSVDWKKKEEEMGKTERKAMDIILRWFGPIGDYFYSCHLWNEEYVGLLRSIVDVLLASRDNHSEICEECVRLFKAAAENRAVKLVALLKSGAIDAALEEIPKSTLNRRMTYEFINFFHLISMRFKGKGEAKTTEEERKELKRKIFEKQEEEGFEDIIVRFQKTNRFYYANDAIFIHL